MATNLMWDLKPLSLLGDHERPFSGLNCIQAHFLASNSMGHGHLVSLVFSPGLAISREHFFWNVSHRIRSPPLSSPPPASESALPYLSSHFPAVESSLLLLATLTTADRPSPPPPPTITCNSCFFHFLPGCTWP
mmetsp:Transcript_97002/g.167300  ORF Transcript_97002/g.167300 Transcript_97002/m.167300 type:complete len:134 (-) Transcript_97002:276-677(-)